MNTSDTKKVFISHSIKDKELAEILCNQLEMEGIDCWMAPRDVKAGGDYAEAIYNAIGTVELVAVLLSNESMTSDDVEREIALAGSEKKSVLPIRIDDAELIGKWKYHLANRQWVFASGNDPLTRFSIAIRAIRSHIQSIKNQDDLMNTTLDGQSSGFSALLEEAETSTTAPPAGDKDEGSFKWPEIAVKFLKDFRDLITRAGLAFEPQSISGDEDIEEKPEVDWFIDTKHYLALWFKPQSRRGSKVNMLMGIYSTGKRDPDFRAMCKAFTAAKKLLNDEGEVVIGDRIYEPFAEDYLGFETKERIEIGSLGNREFLESIGKDFIAFIQGVWPIAKQHL